MTHLEALNQAKEMAANGHMTLESRLAAMTTLLAPFGWRCELASGQVVNFIRDKKFSADAFITSILVGGFGAFFWIPFSSLPIWYLIYYVISRSPRQNYVLAPYDARAAAKAA